MEWKTYRSQLLRIVLDRLRVQDLSVVFAHFQVLVVVVGEDDLLLEVAELEVGHVVIDLHRSLVRSPGLLALFGLLPPLLDLLGALLGLARKVPPVDLATQDGGLRPVASLYAQRHLFQNELRLLPSGHRPECLHLQLAKDVGRRVDIALGLSDVR